MARKLTPAQADLLRMISDPVFRIDGLQVFGHREFRTAASLDRRGLAHLSVEQRLKITDAGRAAIFAAESSALTSQGGSDGGAA